MLLALVLTGRDDGIAVRLAQAALDSDRGVGRTADRLAVHQVGPETLLSRHLVTKGEMVSVECGVRGVSAMF